MVEERVVLEFEPTTQDAIIDALRILHKSGVFLAQIKANTLAVVESFEAGTEQSVAAKVLQVRQTTRQLLDLHELAGSILKVTEHEQES